ncbi:hypothetical protein [Lentzea sp. CC55]|uniref:hypothetical protein n=1 Tax=Lentzea sp. CC55 TaxID=2884909 RepID=UPI001F393070|nr:hypothetical protein [Lentzea sp. CC55]MCG8925327.1 hypothetical protein [Lentzea sp. CC55]
MGYVISGAALAAAVVHVVWPSAKIDATTVLLLGLALVPWLGNLLESLELPGGLKLQYRELEERVEQVETEGKASIDDASSVAQAALGAARLGSAVQHRQPAGNLPDLDELVLEMRRLRQLPYSESRTDIRDQVFGAMIVVAGREPGFDIGAALRDDDPDRRLAGYAGLHGKPDAELVEAVVDVLAREQSAFNQYWAIKALRVLTGLANPSEVTPKLAAVLKRLREMVPTGSSRAHEVDLLSRSLGLAT